MIALIAFVVGLFSRVSAGPIKNFVYTSTCLTHTTGVLTANGQNIGLSPNNTLSFGGNGLEVDFQSCQPNFGHFSGENGVPMGGHILVKSTNTCLTLLEYQPSFTFTVEKCDPVDDSRQTLSNFVFQDDKIISFVGGTHADGSFIWHQDDCSSGFFGVTSGVTEGPVKFGCVTSASPNSLTLRQK